MESLEEMKFEGRDFVEINTIYVCIGCYNVIHGWIDEEQETENHRAVIAYIGRASSVHPELENISFAEGDPGNHNPSAEDVCEICNSFKNGSYEVVAIGDLDPAVLENRKFNREN